jgi:hypothetical protein
LGAYLIEKQVEQDVFELKSKFLSKFSLTDDEAWDCAVNLYLYWKKRSSIKSIPHTMYYFKYVDMVRKKTKKSIGRKASEKRDFVNSLNNYNELNENLYYEYNDGENKRMEEAIDLIIDHASNHLYGKRNQLSGKQILLTILSGVAHEDVAEMLGLARSRVTQIYQNECERIKRIVAANN